MNTRAIKQWIARTLLFLPSESAGQMLRRYRKELASINELKGTDYGLFLMDWSKMLSDENNMESDMPYFTERTGDGSDATAICLYKRGSDQYVILNKCLYDTKKDADGYRKEYWGNKTDDSIIWIVLDDAIERYIDRYNKHLINNKRLVRNKLKPVTMYVASKERGLSVWIARDKDGEISIYKSKPWKRENEPYHNGEFDSDDYYINIDKELYPEITWENSPKEFELKAVEE